MSDIWLRLVMVPLVALLLWGCASERLSPETCRQERQRSKPISRSSFCSVAAPAALDFGGGTYAA
jgi:hypothetical protein